MPAAPSYAVIVKGPAGAGFERSTGSDGITAKMLRCVWNSILDAFPEALGILSGYPSQGTRERSDIPGVVS